MSTNTTTPPANTQPPSYLSMIIQLVTNQINDLTSLTYKLPEDQAAEVHKALVAAKTYREELVWLKIQSFTSTITGETIDQAVDRIRSK